jgi:hypothetical protein
MRTIAGSAGNDMRGFVRLLVSERMRSDPGRVAALLSAERPWAGLRREPDGPADLRRFGLDLKLRLGGDDGGVTTFGKAAFLDLGPVDRAPAGWVVEISWQASSAAPLFPVFAGRLAIEPGELRLEGLYAPPGGVVGRVADRMLLHLAANGTARWLLREIDLAALETR